MTVEPVPALRSIPGGRQPGFPAGLPNGPTELVGRRSELDRIGALVAAPATRLVTLTGPGGVGKTTLAVTAARQLWARYEGAVLFVSIAPATETGAVYQAIAEHAGWDTDNPDATRALVERGLADAPTLLVLDNCEQVDGLGAALADLLAAAPDLVVLATSRHPLGLSSEQLVSVDPFAVPPDQAGVRDLAGNDAASVLVNAARRRNAAFAVNRDNAPAIAALCRRLDGLPLALELAGARLHLLPPQQLLELLDHRFDVLKVDTTDTADRHRRLWATIDWSYQLLDSDDQGRFRWLGVFADGFTLDAAAAVVGCTQIEMLDTIDRLVAEHMVRPMTGRAGSARFDMLESIREFALAELERGDELGAAVDAHSEWVAELAQRWGPALTDGDAQDQAFAVLDAERANVALALQRALDGHRPERVLETATPLWRYWWYRGMSRPGRAWLEAALAQQPEPTLATAAAYAAAGDLAEISGDLTRARELIEPALAIFEQHGHDEQLARARNALGFVERELGNLEYSRELHEQALTAGAQLGSVRIQASALNGLGATANRTGDQTVAARHYREALEFARQTGDPHAAPVIAQNLAAALTATGDLVAARAILQNVVDESHQIGDVQNRQVALLNLAECDIATGQFEAAASHLYEAEQIALDTGTDHFRVVVTYHRGVLADARGDIGGALDLFTSGLAAALRVIRPIETTDLLERIGALAVELGDDAVARTALSTARSGRAATSTSPLATVAEWERVLAERGTPVDASKTVHDDWPAPARAIVDELAVFAATHRHARRDASSGGADESFPGLTPRESQVARLLAARRTDQEIADELLVALRTATTHVSAVLRKLGVTSRRDVATRLAELVATQGG